MSYAKEQAIAVMNELHKTIWCMSASPASRTRMVALTTIMLKARCDYADNWRSM